MADKELAIYVHVPFCWRKCRYCAFYSEPLNAGSARVPGYLRTIRRELAVLSWHLNRETPLKGVSLFLGGGTPTALRAPELAALLASLQAGLSLSPLAERTAESNPGTLTAEKLAVLRDYGINRISLGVQSFQDALLRRIGRMHSSEQAEEAIRLIRASGVRNLNLDLMFGLPGQTRRDWEQTVERALAYEPEHLSLYGLMLEEGTPLGDEYLGKGAAKASDLPDDDEQADMYQWAAERLRQAGYGRYETSNFALPGKECRHHLNYWRGKDYLGLGPGAVSCLDGQRWKNRESVEEYIHGMGINGKSKAPPREESETLSREQRMTERVMLGLRLAEGVDIRAFERDFGAALSEVFAEALPGYISREILIIEDGFLRLAPAYAFVANAILRDFVL